MKKLFGGIVAASLLAARVGISATINGRAPVETKADEGYDYFYIVQGAFNSGWGDRYLYGWKEGEGNNVFGGWPGTKVINIPNIESTQNLSFGGGGDGYWNGGIYRVQVSKANPIDRIQFNLGSNNGKTPDIPLTYEHAYFYDGKGGYHDNWFAKDQESYSLGQAAKVVFDFYKAIGTTATICSGGGAFASMTPAQRGAKFAELYSEYYIACLDEGARGWINNTTMTTSNQTIESIAEEFYRVAVREGYVLNTSNGEFVKEESRSAVGGSIQNYNVSPVITLAVAGVVTFVAGGAFLVLRKRKMN